MSRLSLLKVWNSCFTVFVFLLPVLVIAILGALSKGDALPMNYIAAALVQMGAALLWSIYTNHVLLPWLAKGRVCWKSFWLMLLQAKVAVDLSIAFHAYWTGGPVNVGEIFLLGFFLPFLLFKIFVPLFLFAVFANAYVMKFLYQRRDYLPEYV